MREIALHVLDIAENSVAAGASIIEITVEEDLPNDRLKLIVQDNGRGMGAEILEGVTNPFVTSRTTRKVGLGIPLLKAAAEACQGHLYLDSMPGQGTRLQAEFQRSHIDRMPLGDLAGTWLTLIIACPNVHWLFHYRAKTQEKVASIEFTFDDAPIKQEVTGIPLTEPSILAFIRQLLQEGVSSIQEAIAEADKIPDNLLTG